MNDTANKHLIRLLLVEDDQVDRIRCKRELEKNLDYQFEILEAETGEQGLKLARTECLDCILLDHNLPDFNGTEFLAELADDSGEQPVPVVMLTGFDNATLAAEALKLGAYDYVVKGVEREPLQWLPAVVLRSIREHQAIIDKAVSAMQLHEAEAKYRTLVEQIPTITYVAALDDPGKLLYISPQVQQLGFSPEECLAYPEGFLTLLYDVDRQPVIAAYSQTYQHHTPLHCEYRLTAQDGQNHWFLDKANIVFSDLGAPLFLQGILLDITKDKEIALELANYRQHLEELVAQRTEELSQQNVVLAATNTKLAQTLGELRQAEGELRVAAVAFESQAAIAVTNADKMILRVNKAFTRITGYSIKEAMSLSVFSYKQTNISYYLDIWATVENEGYWEGEAWERNKSGEDLVLWVTLSKVTDQDTNIRNYVATFTDITALKQAERILLDARERLENEVITTQEELEKTKAETTEINTALNVLIRHKETDKTEAQSALSYELDTTVLPLLKKLKGMSKNRLQSLRMVSMLEDNLKNMMKTYGNNNHVNSVFRKLSPIEAQVASMVKFGQPTKVIAATLNIAAGTVSIHRKHIRKKLELDSKTNLQSYLQSLMDENN